MVFTSFDVALRKFHGSYGIGGPLEHLVDLATALEATLASGDKDNAGLTLRLRNRAAALLATTNDPGPTIFADVGRLYGLRSTLVHGGQSKEAAFWRTIEQVSTVPAQESRARLRGVDLDRAVDRMRDLVRRAILARVCLAGGSDPLWPFSGEVSVDALLTDDAVREKWRTYWQTQLREIGAGDAIGPPRFAADFLSPDE